MVKSIIIKIIDIYQKISKRFPAKCRYYPSCSEYTRQAIEKYGPLSGIFVGLKRIIKCNQLFVGGYDPLK
ncbi:MAG: membrane protein insertion efficiency factor YidD [Candidatus Margulisiibacteriota bacterium]